VSTPAASSDVPQKVDAIQYEVGEGPCLDAIREHEVFRTGDLGRERRWPRFSARAQKETGVTSMVCFRLFVEGDTLGALNLYSKVTDAFDDRATAVGSVFAAHAAVALSTALHDEQMEEALESRDVIGQAKGILMAREHVNADEAFDMLRRASQRVNVKLRDIARQIADSASDPPPSGEGEQGGA
jgi:transcriptional regulator with GAF, ATPase, and Fis domain